MLFLDTESIGLTGPLVLIQYARDDENVTLHNVFEHSVRDTLKLIKRICENDICVFNLTHDWFQLVKCFNIFDEVFNKSRPPRIDELVALHKRRPTKLCLRPKRALDLYLHAIKTEYQGLLGRENIQIKKVPLELGQPLARVLRDKIDLSPLYFVKRQDGYEWQVEPIEDEPTFCNVTLRFAPSAGLKPLSEYVLHRTLESFPIPDKILWKERTYNPYATEWEQVIQYHLFIWQNVPQALKYAEEDVIVLRELYKHFNCPTAGDVDSELAAAVGACRWAGFSLDTETIDAQRITIHKELSNIEVNVNSHVATRDWLLQVCNGVERAAVTNTSKETLDIISKWQSEVGKRAKQVLHWRKLLKKYDVLNKLAEVGRFCPEFRVIGARSGRMSGGGVISDSGKKKGSLNPQGIQRDPEIRKLFTLADKGETLSGGDFNAFEVTIADAVYNDPTLRADLTDGKSIHGYFGSLLYSEAYEQVMASKGTLRNMYNPAKNSFLGFMYGAQAKRIATTAGVSEDTAEQAYEKLIERYPRIGVCRGLIFDSFCTMRQPGGIGTPIHWSEPQPYIETLFGFRRYFVVENQLIHALFELAQSPPDSLNAMGKCVRRDREQTLKGAAQSALYATAFQMQARNMRSAANHVIQGTGAQLCKFLQYQLWQFQPVGIAPWHIKLLNIHDEILAVHSLSTTYVNETVNDFIKYYRQHIPLLSISWNDGASSWADLK